MRITRKPGERYCADCVQEQLDRNDKKAWEAAHSWAAVGYNFKTPLYFHKIPSNKNGKMTLTVYRNEILEKIVKPWLKRHQSPFILEEGNDSGHGRGSQSNIVAKWKSKNYLDCYFNYPSSPDLSPIENC
ncbi:hypothetical protein BU25DRAFT_418302 [Macroventuria anomochaeta]|uniref:Uncharacterized protein n=1 Tax=Macroventuria anomochaeta TaxID=301207 RepID=A0ACB6SBC6_9PLEO|nr:uncharacterized protein BU25DRAFT_418302 [Macroventuria anomochaeta]KAF2631516.1 hypothetical protein BU25DRAFT_418302 [Macroventuria anomochaeta]